MFQVMEDRMLRRDAVVAATVFFTFAGLAGQQAQANNLGPSRMTANWCREQIVNEGITDPTKFGVEMKKCRADPTTYK
jgi:hypothetical protein